MLIDTVTDFNSPNGDNDAEPKGLLFLFQHLYQNAWQSKTHCHSIYTISAEYHKCFWMCLKVKFVKNRKPTNKIGHNDSVPDQNFHWCFWYQLVWLEDVIPIGQETIMLASVTLMMCCYSYWGYGSYRILWQLAVLQRQVMRLYVM